jgi:integral membrane protein (TIGR01906 family)
VKFARAVIFFIFVCCLPLLLLTITLGREVNEIRLYEYGFDKYQISQATGIDALELRRVAQQLIDYFNLKADSVQVVVSRGGQKLNLFNERELTHLQDVRGLVQLDYWVQRAVLILMVFCGLVLLLWLKAGWGAVLRGLLWGSLVTFGLMIFLAFWAMFGFDRLFILFHEVSFSNEYWILDPTRDYLIMLFPGGFFYDAALLGFGAVILEALILGGIALGVQKLVAKQSRVV